MDLFNPDFLDDRVYQGLWTRHQGPSYSSRILTLSSYNSLVVLASLAVLIQYCGARSWVIIRQAIYEGLRRKEKLPLRLPGSSPEPLHHLTPGRAIVNTFSWAERLGRGWLWPQNEHPSPTSPSPPEYDPGQSPVFGTFALVNTLFFLFIGIALPYFLTEGAFGAPIVKSRPMPDCMNIDRNSSNIQNFIGYAATTQKADSIFRECGESLNASCFRGYYMTTPNIEKRRLEHCPFPVNVCDNRSKPFEITHLNKTAFEAGMNSPSDLKISHRTTCAPVVTEPFMLWQPSANRSWVSVRTTRDSTPGHHVINYNFVVPLRTMNGPNVVSDINSGLQSFRDNGPLDVTVLPGFQATVVIGFDPEGWEYVHESLRREDAQSFMIVYTAGRSWYDSEVDDPFFSAHTYDAEIDNLNASTKPMYLPDREATTIACMDQFQMCFGPESRPWCSGWSNGSDVMGEILNMWKQNFDDPGGQLRGSFMDIFTFVPSAISTSKVHQSMAVRNQMQPQLVMLRDGFQTSRQGYGDEQWTLEVETWFMKAIVDSILHARLYAKYQTADFNSSLGLLYREIFGDRILDEWPTCGRVLFQNSNYTNINWYGFCAVLGALLLICILSLFEERLVDVVFASLGIIRHPARAAAAVKSTSIAIINKVSSLRKVILGMLSGVRLFIIPLLAYLKPRSGRRPEPTRPENPPAALGSPEENRDSIDLQNLENLRRGEDADNPI